MALAAAAGLALAVGSASAAHAIGEYYSWNDLNTPLRATGYGSEVQGYGQWRVANGSSGAGSFLDARLWLWNADNHAGYAILNTFGNCWTEGGSQVCGAFRIWKTAETPRNSSQNTWQWKYANTTVSPESNQARAGVYVCIDVPWRTDPCAGQSYAGPTNY